MEQFERDSPKNKQKEEMEKPGNARKSLGKRGTIP
jgi:hypothetical protein